MMHRVAGIDVEKPAQPIERVTGPFARFAREERAGALVLLLGVAVAVIWANSPWRPVYERLLESPVAFSAGDFVIRESVRHWINDAVMAVFFFVVGLEIKREFLVGELSSARGALLPLFGALGGMVVPAALYLAVNPTGGATRGWGIPMATDIAFALGALSLVKGVPGALRVFLTALAIVDDIGAIAVIALFYSESVSVLALGLSGVFLVAAFAANALGVRSPLAYLLIGCAMWLAVLKSGVHPTLAAVLMAFAIPARTYLDGARFTRRMRALLDQLGHKGLPGRSRMLEPDQYEVLDDMDDTVDRTMTPSQRLEDGLAPLVTFVVLPLFAFANSGIVLDAHVLEAFWSPVFAGVVLGLFVGKQLGILGFAWIAVRLGWAELPAGVGWRQLHGAGVIAGIGFTMALFIDVLAFRDPLLREQAKLGIVCASVCCAALGPWLLHRARPRKEARPA